ncbi:hypothetical protein F9L33_00965 [Amylibacter sp. SFDW26]|uniref:hypothetical protein n=1 Tax=Amylibacter sp. SFDW26 TaxID=2652722 RepID=UPI0012624470|nr:hypothetical protein [Amylibacter sp. SFDW26]KAB7615370.1 hypothetical protein F9L33_00965 [Amylibacter sp. SFDW26]
MITNEEARQLAEDYLKEDGTEFYYKFVGVKKSMREKDIVYVQFLWSSEPNNFTNDGPIFIDVDTNTRKVISEKP